MNLAAPSPSGTPPPQLRDIVGPQAYHLPGDYIWIALALIAGALAAYLVLRYWRRPKKAGPSLTARQIAAARLLELRQLAPEMEPRLFGAEVSRVLSAYIGAEFHLHPERQTSSEFLISMAENRIFSPAEHTMLAEFLSQCDLLKFARHGAAIDAKETLLSQAANFIEKAGVGAAPTLPLEQRALAGVK